MSKLIFGAVVFVSFTAFSPVVMAEEGPCRADIQKYCKDVKPGGGRIIECLKQHEADLSPACKARGAEAKEEMNELKQACKSDVEQYCKGVKRGQGRIWRCMKQNESKFTDACKTAMDKAEAKHKAAKEKYQGKGAAADEKSED